MRTDKLMLGFAYLRLSNEEAQDIVARRYAKHRSFFNRFDYANAMHRVAHLVTDLKHGPHPFFFLRTELKAEQVN